MMKNYKNCALSDNGDALKKITPLTGISIGSNKDENSKKNNTQNRQVQTKKKKKTKTKKKKKQASNVAEAVTRPVVHQSNNVYDIGVGDRVMIKRTKNEATSTDATTTMLTGPYIVINYLTAINTKKNQSDDKVIVQRVSSFSPVHETIPIHQVVPYKEEW